VGLGYVGLPLAVKLAEAGFSVTGIDIAEVVILKIEEGKSTVEGLSDDRIGNVLATKKLDLAALPDDPHDIPDDVLRRLSGIDIFVICVPTPLQAGGWEPDLVYIAKAGGILRRICDAEREADLLPQERLIVLESTTYPGTTRKFFPPLLSEFDRKQWHLAYSPERTNPGPLAIEDAYEIPRVVGGIDDKSLAIACDFYRTIYPKIERASSLEAAEMTKLVENTFRFVSIAFANEMARVAKALNLNVWEVLGKAMTKGFGLELCYPGLIGGHCVPIDPHYLAFAMRAHREPTGFIDLAEKIHQDTRRYAIDLVHALLNRRKRPVAGSKIVFFGVAYKANIGDIRESAALQVMKSLHADGAIVSYWDPVRSGRSVKSKPQLVFTKEERSTLPPDVAETLKERDKSEVFFYEPEELGKTWDEVRGKILSDDVSCIVLATAHTEFRGTYAEILSAGKRPAIADLCNAIEPWLREEIETDTDDPGAAERYRTRLKNGYALLGFSSTELPQHEVQPANAVLS
jgi:UDP-N-acetyl-D-glucosamine dehydrogenase